MIFQDPFASLNPRKTVGGAIAEPMVVHGLLDLARMGEPVTPDDVYRLASDGANGELPAQTSLSRYMQFVHSAVFGVAYLRAMNFVTQPSVELYKTIAGEIYADAKRAGGVSKTAAWCSLTGSVRQSSWRRRLTMYYDTVDAEAGSGDAAARDSSTVPFEGGTERRHVRKPVGGRSAQRDAERVVDVLRHAIANAPNRPHGVRQLLREDRARVRPGERRLAGEHLVHDAP